MKTNLLKIVLLVFALGNALLISAQTVAPNHLTEVIKKYQSLPFYTDDQPDILSVTNDDNLKSTTEYYEVDGVLLSEILFQLWENGSWVNNAKMVNSYDNNEVIIETISYTWDTDAWKEVMKLEYTINASGDPEEMLTYMWNENEQEWLLMFRDTYTYNGSGWLTELLSEMWMVTQWMNNSKIEYSYDGAGNVIEELDTGWDMMTSTWTNVRKTNSTYLNNLITEELIQLWQNEAWMNESNSFWEYNGGTHYTEVLQKMWDGQWENFTRGTPTYNGDWNVIEHLYEVWLNAAWENNNLQFYTYNSNGYVTEIISQGWEVNTWVNQMKMIYSYSGVGIFEYSKTGAYCNDLKNYPNPFVSETTISFDIIEDCSVNLEVFDLTGRKVATLLNSYLKPGSYAVSWNGTNDSGNKLESGIYLYKINTNGESMVKKMTISN